FGGPVFNQFVFVRARDFCSPLLQRFAVRHDVVPLAIRTHWRDHLGRVPDRRRVERESGPPVHVVTGRPGHMPPPWQGPPRGPGGEAGWRWIGRDERVARPPCWWPPWSRSRSAAR